MLRLTGRVVRTDLKSGNTADKTTGELRAWSFTIVKVLVAEQDIAEVSIYSDSTTPVPAVGSEVDYAVIATVRGSRLNVTLDKPWADLFAPSSSAARPVKVA